MDHATGCTEQTRVPNCFACHMESEKEKYGDNVQLFSGDTLTVEVTEDGKLNVLNPHEESYQTLAPEYWFNKVQWDIERMPDDKKTHLSDGYHSFKDLYDHRVQLFVALCNTLIALGEAGGSDADRPWKSKLHADGTMWEGWFIAGIGYEEGETITYHLPITQWDRLNSDILENAPEWDGHTSEDVLLLLSKI